MKFLFRLIFLSIALSASAQHDHSKMNHPMPSDPESAQPKRSDSTHQHTSDVPMSHGFSLNLPMTRNGSGTSWLPDESPMYGAMFHSKKWMFMAHGNLFVRYNHQDVSGKGSRGGEEFDAPNWLMFMGQRKSGQKGLFRFSAMLSFDALTGGNSGYPLLFQSGEAYRGQALVDRQHPHDLFSELSVSYAYAISDKMDVFAYVGYPGEPAIGPTAFMHRPSALYNPDAPLTHHWIDATHITFGVATLGFRYDKFKIEASSFTGREPDEHRYDFDKPRFDSFSGRLSYNPTQNWALQVSHAYIKSPEILHPGDDVSRTTASVNYAKKLENGWFNAVALWGMNKSHDPSPEHAALLEASWQKRKLAVYGRYEFVEKSVEELSLDEDIYGHSVFPVNAATIGLNYEILSIGKFKVAAGGQFSVYTSSSRLDDLYGNNPIALQAYLRLFPSLMQM